MKQLEQKQLKAKVSAIANANDPEMVQEVLVNLCYQAYHGNISNSSKLKPKHIPSNIRGFIGKWVPMKLVDKEKGLYEYCKIKSEKILNTLELDFKPSFEDVAEKLPKFDQKTNREKPALDSKKKVEALIKALEKALEEDNIVDKDHANWLIKNLK